VLMRGRRVVYRCSKGHLFTHGWWWPMFGGAYVVRLGFAGYMRCPVGRHWALVKFVKEADLTEQERENVIRLLGSGDGELSDPSGRRWQAGARHGGRG
jgi:hypothetical protein